MVFDVLTDPPRTEDDVLAEAPQTETCAKCGRTYALRYDIISWLA